jgi:hypothetical protein
MKYENINPMQGSIAMSGPAISLYIFNEESIVPRPYKKGMGSAKVRHT